MADSFRDREKGFESKYAHDEELRFKVMNRRNKLLGLWAAGLNGLSGADADSYARTVVQADFQEAGDSDVFRKLKADLGAKQSDQAIRAKMEELFAEAGDQITREGK